ncbi:MAG: outer membrane protein [Thermodesulfobacteriota bacterium]
MVSSFSNTYGEEDRKIQWGFSLSAGTDQKSRNDLVMYSLLPKIDLPLHKNWDLEFEGNLSYYGIDHSKDLYLLGVNANILFKPIQWNKNFLFLIGGMGLAYNNNSDKYRRVRDIGDSHIAGILQIGSGIQHYLGRGLWVRAEYRFHHISDPFQRDPGINTHNFIVGLSFIRPLGR